MQSTQFKSDSTNTNLTLNLANTQTQTTQTDSIKPNLSLNDPSFNDSLSVNYIAPDSVIFWGGRPEWSQFRKAYTPKHNYKNELTHQLPFDSLHTVLKGVEVVFPGKKIFRSNPDWLIGVVLAAFLIFATVRLIFNKYLGQLFHSAINYSTFTRLFRERYFNLLHASFRLDLLFNLELALLIYQFLSIHKMNQGFSKTYLLYTACFGFIVAYFFAKRFIYYLLGILTESKPEVLEYLFSITVYNRILGVFLLPVTTIIAFVPLTLAEPLLYLGLFIVVVFYILAVARGIKIFLRKQFSISYLILYLCTLEILPLLLIYSILLN
jgi:hypothetical protein